MAHEVYQAVRAGGAYGLSARNHITLKGWYDYRIGSQQAMGENQVEARR